MLEENNHNSAPPKNVTTDRDSLEFRNESLPKVTTLLEEQLASYKEVFKTKNPSQMQSVLLESSDQINRTVMGAEISKNIYSNSEIAILHSSGIVIWEKPKDPLILERKIIEELTTQFTNEQIDEERFAKGVYFLEVLLHKYENGNGRTARAMKLLIEKTGDTNISKNEVEQVLSITKDDVTEVNENTLQINFNPDFKRLILGVAYFGLDKGLSQDEVIEELKLNGTLPEKGLDVLSKKLNLQKSQLKDEFIHFMTVTADLSWCDFTTTQ